MNNLWKYHDSKMIELKKLYNNISRQTQNRLQEIFKLMQMEFSDLYKIVDTNKKRKINAYIEELKEKGLLKGYFKAFAQGIYRNPRIRNIEMLELLIYSAYIEEQSKIEEKERKIFKEDVNYYYQEGQKEVNNKKVSVIPDAIFLALLDMPDSNGYIWNQYIEAIIKYNSDQILRQSIITIQQGKELDIDSIEFQNIITKQQNSKLSIKSKAEDTTVSGHIDNMLIGMNNKAKAEGIVSLDEDGEVLFISVDDDRRTEMCKSLDGQRFKIKGKNIFERYSASNDSIVKYECDGLVVGLNLPPINDHYHVCRSTIMYLRKEYDEDNESDIFEGIRYKIKQILYENKLAEYKDLPKSYKMIYEKGIQKSESNTKRILQNITNKTDYLITNNGNSKYNRKLDMIKLNVSNNDVSTLAHELFHKIDEKNKITKNNDLRKYIEKDLKRIGTNRESFINEISKYDINAFTINKLGKYELKEKYRGISDIINGYTDGRVKLGYFHSKEYWNRDRKNLSRETFAQFGRMYYDNDSMVIHTLEHLLPSTKQMIDINLRRIK